MSFQEFVLWSHQTKVVPVLCTPEDIKLIFRQVQKWQHVSMQSAMETKNQEPARDLCITYSTFKKALVKVCIYGHEVLLGAPADLVNKEQVKIKEILLRKEYERKVLHDTVMQELSQEFQIQMAKR